MTTVLSRIGEVAGKGIGRIKSIGDSLKALTGIGVSKVTTVLSRIGEVAGKGIGSIKSMGDSLKALTGIGVSKLTTVLSRIGEVAGIGIGGIKSLGGSLKALTGIGIGKINTALSRIGEVAGKGIGGIKSLGGSLKALTGIGVGKLTTTLSKVGSAAGKGIGGIKLIAGSVAGIANNAIKTVGKLTGKLLSTKGTIGKVVGAIQPFGKSLTELASKYLTLGNAQKVINIADTYTNTSAKLSLLTEKQPDDQLQGKDFAGTANTEKQTVDQLQDKIFAAAARSRGSYTDMAANIVKMGASPKNSFDGNDELIAFTELVQKSFKIGGAGAEEQQAGMDQIVKAMSGDKIQVADFKSILESAPLVADAVAKFTGKSKEELASMGDEGSISANIIKKSMFAASDDIDAKFKDAPMTFADVFGRIKDGALQAFGPVIERLTGIIDSPGFQKAMNNILGVINIIAAGIDWVISIVQSNWSTIEPILLSIIGALALIALVYLPIMLVQWMILNWPILLIGAAIALLLYLMIEFGDTTAEIFGYIGGGIGVLVALIYNMIADLVNSIAILGDFIVNLFIDILNSAIDDINKIIEAINNIPGVEIGLIGKLENVESAKMEYMDPGKAYENGQNIGKAIGGSLKGIGDKLPSFPGATGFDIKMPDTSKTPTGPDTTNLDKYMQNGSLPVTGKDGGNLNVDMSEEDLKYMQDIAEREYINKFSTATLAPNVSISFGNVTKEVDVDNVIRRVGKIMREEIAMVSEGGYVV